MVREILLLLEVLVENVVVVLEVQQEFLQSWVRESVTPKDKESRNRQAPRSGLMLGQLELEGGQFRLQVLIPHQK